MLHIQTIAKDNFNLSAALAEKERSLRGKQTTFFMSKRNVRKHEKYPGWINIKKISNSILIFEIQTRAEGKEWQLIQAFTGYLHRHFAINLDQISIFYK